MYSVGDNIYAKVIDVESAFGYTIYKNHEKWNCFTNTEINKIIGIKWNSEIHTIILTLDNRLWWQKTWSYSSDSKVTEIESINSSIIDICLQNMTLNILFDNGTVSCINMCFGKDYTPKPKELPNNIIVTAVALGSHHTISLTNAGNVYSWGNNEYGQLGFERCKRKTIPELISADTFNLSPVTSIACGDNHSVFLTAANSVHTTGSNECKQLALSERKLYNLPQKIPYDFECIRSVHACADHTILLSQSNNIYTAGSNRYGQLGLGKNPLPGLSCCNFFSTIDITINEIICDHLRTLVVTTDGHVYGAGKVCLPNVPHTCVSWTKIKMPNDGRVAVNKSGMRTKSAAIY